MASRREEFVVGIDLGTTHSAMASSPRSRKGIEVLPIPQLVGPGEVASLPLLPSALYLPSEGELPEGATRLPWGEPEWVAGEWARRLGARIPSRLVFSAKSWLSHPGADSTAAILPWCAPDAVERISPVEASARIPSHLRAAWEEAHPDRPPSQQAVVLTIPLASGRRPLRGLPALGRAGRGGADLAGGGLRADRLPPAGGLGRGASRPPAFAAGGGADHPGLLRRGGARTHRAGGAAGGPGEIPPPRGAASRLLRLSAASRRRGGEAPRWAATRPRPRRRRWHHRLHPDPRGAAR